MATASEYGAIAVIISVTIIGTVAATHYFGPVDQIKVNLDRLNAECAKPRPDGGPREIVRRDDGSYAICPRR